MGVVAEMCSTDVNGECWSRLVGREAYSKVNARRWGTTCQVVLLLVVVVEERTWSSDGGANCWRWTLEQTRLRLGGSGALLKGIVK